jgi:CheY-like chemotaxis protein
VAVRAVTSTEEAILKILDDPPHLVLATAGSDHHRVFHLLEQIREDSDLRLLPFAFLSESDDRVFKVRAYRMGADEVLLKRTSLEELVVRIENMLARDAARRATELAAPQRGISGSLANLALPDIFQILSLGLKTARVTLEHDGARGTIWFDSGVTVHAELAERAGVETCYEMLRWKDGTFCIEHGLRTEDVTIEMDTMMIVMEGLRLADEATAAPADLVAG